MRAIQISESGVVQEVEFDGKTPFVQSIVGLHYGSKEIKARETRFAAYFGVDETLAANPVGSFIVTGLVADYTDQPFCRTLYGNVLLAGAPEEEGTLCDLPQYVFNWIRNRNIPIQLLGQKGAAERTFRNELRGLLNGHSMENGSNTPDFILADYLIRNLESFDAAVNIRSDWYGRRDAPGQSPPGEVSVRHPVQQKPIDLGGDPDSFAPNRIRVAEYGGCGGLFIPQPDAADFARLLARWGDNGMDTTVKVAAWQVMLTAHMPGGIAGVQAAKTHPGFCTAEDAMEFAAEARASKSVESRDMPDAESPPESPPDNPDDPLGLFGKMGWLSRGEQHSLVIPLQEVLTIHRLLTLLYSSNNYVSDERDAMVRKLAEQLVNPTVKAAMAQPLPPAPGQDRPSNLGAVTAAALKNFAHSEAAKSAQVVQAAADSCSIVDPQPEPVVVGVPDAPGSETKAERCPECSRTLAQGLGYCEDCVRKSEQKSPAEFPHIPFRPGSEVKIVCPGDAMTGCTGVVSKALENIRWVDLPEHSLGGKIRIATLRVHIRFLVDADLPMRFEDGTTNALFLNLCQGLLKESDWFARGKRAFALGLSGQFTGESPAPSEFSRGYEAGRNQVECQQIRRVALFFRGVQP